MEESVQGILSELNQWDSVRKQARIGQLLADIDQSRRELAEGYSKLKTVRSGETEVIDLDFGEYRGTPQSLALRMVAEMDLHGWMGIDVSPAVPAPLTNEEASALLRFWRDLGDDAEEDFRKVLPELAAIPAPGSFDQMVLKERELGARLQSFGPETSVPLHILSSAPIDTRRAMESALGNSWRCMTGFRMNRRVGSRRRFRTSLRGSIIPGTACPQRQCRSWHF